MFLRQVTAMRYTGLSVRKRLFPLTSSRNRARHSCLRLTSNTRSDFGLYVNPLEPSRVFTTARILLCMSTKGSAPVWLPPGTTSSSGSGTSGLDTKQPPSYPVRDDISNLLCKPVNPQVTVFGAWFARKMRHRPRPKDQKHPARGVLMTSRRLCDLPNECTL